MQFEDPLDNDNLKPINHWTLAIYEADDAEDLNTPYDEFNLDYEINSTGNGVYSIDVNVNMNYYLLQISLVRIDREHDHMIYRTGKIQGSIVAQYPVLSAIKTNDGQPQQFSYTYIQTTGPLEVMRRCALIASRIDFALTTNVGGDNLYTIQTLEIGTLEITDPLITSATSIETYGGGFYFNRIKIGNNNDNRDLLDGNIFHEYGHSLQNALNNLVFDYTAQGDHYADQKSNTHLAFSEGWADFWACAVLDDEDLYYPTPYNLQLDLSNVDKDYIYSITSQSANIYLPEGITIYDGVENEALVAAALWELKESAGLPAVWTGMKSTINDGVSTRFIKNFLEYLAVNTSLKNSFYTDANKTEDLGFGRNFIFFVKTTILENAIPNQPDKTLIYLQGGNYIISSTIVINNKSFGIIGMDLTQTILIGQADQNTISVTNPNQDDDWFKISDLQLKNGNLSIEVLSSGNDQPKLYMSRCFSNSNMKGVGFGGNAILFNNIFANNLECGLFINSRGDEREIYIYNNVIDNCGIGLRFSNMG